MVTKDKKTTTLKDRVNVSGAAVITSELVHSLGCRPCYSTLGNVMPSTVASFQSTSQVCVIGASRYS